MKKLVVLAASRLFPGRSPMKITRRFALTVLLCLGATLCATAPARAQGFIYPLSCVVGVADPDYGASGAYVFSGRQTMTWLDPVNGIGYTVYVGRLSLRCSGLTPGAVYSVGDKKSHADRDGNLEIQWSHVTIEYRHSAWGGYWAFSPSPVYRLDTGKTSTLVLR